MSSSPDKMSEVTRIGDLYDFYGGLLTERQREVIELYHVDDLSLAEIAETLSISRQAVHDQLRRASDQLESYESALQLCSLANEQRLAWATVWDSVDALSKQVPQASLQGLHEALHTLAKTLPCSTGGEADA